MKNLTKSETVGVALKEEDLDKFSDEQLAQLYELYSEAKIPTDTTKDPHPANH